MATTRLEDKTWMANGDFLKCPVCMKEYTGPKILPCLHSFCFDCLNTSLKQSKIGKGQSFLCPICQYECIVPTRGVPGMKTNIFLITLQEFCHRKTLDLDQVCDVCDSGNVAKQMCIECSDWLCAKCCDIHKQVKITKDHTLVTPDELKRGDFDELLKQSFEPLMCNKHDEPLKLYCTEPCCMAPICFVCKNTLGHDGHVAIALEDQAILQSHAIDSLLPSVQSTIVNSQNRIHKLKHEEKLVNFVRKKTHKQIKNRRDEVVKELLKHINDYCELLHEQVDDVAKDHRKNLRKELEINERQYQQMITAKVFAENLLQFHRPEELVSMSKEVIDRLTDFQNIPNIEIPSWRQPRLHPKAKVSDDHIKKMFGALTFEGEVVKPVLLRSFHAKIHDDAKDCALCDVSLDLDGNLIVVDRDNKKVKVFDKIGNLKLCSGAWILKSPNRVTFLQLSGRILVKDDKYLRIINTDGKFEEHLFADLKQPVGISQNAKGEVLVTDWMDGTVFCFDESGGLVRHFPCASEAPGYICSSLSGNIVVSDWKQHCVKIFDSKGKLLCNYGSYGAGFAELDHPYGVCCDKYGQIIVADTWNNRIHLLSEEGRFINILLDSNDGIMWPQAVITDKKGNLVVVEQHGNIKMFQYMA